MLGFDWWFNVNNLLVEKVLYFLAIFITGARAMHHVACLIAYYSTDTVCLVRKNSLFRLDLFDEALDTYNLDIQRYSGYRSNINKVKLLIFWLVFQLLISKTFETLYIHIWVELYQTHILFFNQKTDEIHKVRFSSKI